jgi:phage gp29-like protein
VVTALTSRPKLRDMTILDQYGQPLGAPRTRYMAAPMNPRGAQTYSSHPEIGLTVESLVAHLWNGERGSPLRMMDMFDGLLKRHAEAEGMFAERSDDVSGCDWALVPGRSDKPSILAAEKLEDYLKAQTCFRSYIAWQLTAVPFGYAATNLVWDYVDKLIVPVEFCEVAHRRFGSPTQDLAHQLFLVDANNGFALRELEAGLWSITTNGPARNVYMSGLMVSCCWWMYFALTGFKDYQVFANMFGLPLAIGYYEEGAGPTSRDALEDAVRSIGQDGYAVLSSLTELVIKESARGGDASTVWPMIMKICDRMLTQRITGGTLNTDVAGGGAGSYNAATVHESREYKMKRRDATRLGDSFVESIGKTFCAWNGFDTAAPPRLQMKISRDELSRAQTLEIIGMAVPLSASQIREEFNLRAPSDASDAVTFVPTPPPEPGKAREQRK